MRNLSGSMKAALLVVLFLIFSPSSSFAVDCANSGKWVQLPDGPRELEDHSAIYDPVRQRMWVFGGTSGSTHFTDGLYYFSLDSLAWHGPIGTNGNPKPVAREGHSAVYDANNDDMVIFAGEATGHTPTGGWLHDAWSLDLSTLTWTCMSKDDVSHDDTWIHFRWYQVAVDDSVHERMIVYGGDYEDAFDDTWALPYDEYSCSSPGDYWALIQDGTGGLPATNAAGMMDAANNRLIVFGGNGGASAPGYYDDLMLLSLGGTPTWSSGPTGPPARYDHVGAYDRRRNRFLIQGGRGENGDLSDVWAYSISGNSWTELSPVGSPPSARCEHTAIYDSKNDQLVIFGGSISGSDTDETWALRFKHEAPDAVTDLYRDVRSLHSISLAWTAPGDSAAEGRACEYDVRYSVTNITSYNFESAAQASGEPAPSTAGTEDYATVSGLNSGSTYYFAMKTKNSDGKWSDISNVISDHTLSGPGAATLDVTPSRLGFTIAKGNPSTRGAVWELAIPASLDRKPYSVSIISPTGHIVRRITDVGRAGTAEVTWDLRNEQGVKVTSGKYFARLEVAGQTLLSSTVVLQ